MTRPSRIGLALGLLGLAALGVARWLHAPASLAEVSAPRSHVPGAPAGAPLAAPRSPVPAARVAAPASAAGDDERARPPAAATSAARPVDEVVGRVVEPGGGAPVDRAPVRVDLTHVYDPRSRYGATTGPDGRFAIDVSGTGVTSFALIVSGPGGRGQRMIHYTGPRFEPRHGPDGDGRLDVGDVELSPFDALRLRVVDAAGAPIAGAHAKPGAEPGHRAERTDAEGRCTIFVPAGSCEAVRVTAAGYATSTAAVPRPPPAELRVALARATSLVVRVTSPSSEAARGLLLELSSERPLFPETGTWVPDGLRKELQTPWRSARHRGPWGFCTFPLTGRETVRVDGVATGEAVVVRVVDTLGAALVAETLEPLFAGELREHALRLDRLGRPFAGLVLDDAGHPVAEADVAIEVPLRGNVGVTTDAYGRFRFGTLAAESVDLCIARGGFVTLGIAGYAPPADGAEAVFHLEPGRAVTVVVRDELGSPVARRTDVTARVPGCPCVVEGERSAAGEWRFTQLPRGSAELVVDSGGREWRRRVGAEQVRVELVVPAPGSLGLSWHLRRESLDGTVPRIVLRARGSGRQAYRKYVQHRLIGEEVVEGVHPGEYELALEALREVLTVRGRETETHLLLPLQRVTIVPGARANARLEP